jgi:hypothetical protein
VRTSKRPQINDVQYLRIPSRILKGARLLDEEVVDDVIAEVAMFGAIVDEAMKSV